MPEGWLRLGPVLHLACLLVSAGRVGTQIWTSFHRRQYCLDCPPLGPRRGKDVLPHPVLLHTEGRNPHHTHTHTPTHTHTKTHISSEDWQQEYQVLHPWPQKSPEQRSLSLIWIPQSHPGYLIPHFSREQSCSGWSKVGLCLFPPIFSLHLSPPRLVDTEVLLQSCEVFWNTNWKPPIYLKTLTLQMRKMRPRGVVSSSPNFKPEIS